MYVTFAILLLAHGFAHLVGFVGPWGMASSAAPQSALLAGRISAGVVGMRIVSVLWLGGSLAFTAAAIGVLRHAPWWPGFTFGAAVASLLLCILGLPQARLGIPINIAIILVLLLTHSEVVTP